MRMKGKDAGLYRNKGPNIEPYGTPHVIAFILTSSRSYGMNCFLHVK